MVYLPHLSLACTALAGLLWALARWIGANAPPEPGDDTVFNLMVGVPVMLAAGLLLGIVAKAKGFGPRRLVSLALLANGGLLAGFLALGILAVASYSGR